jgi:hypothetical protein
MVRTWLGDMISGTKAVSEGLETMKVEAAIAGGMDVRMAPALAPHNAQFELIPRASARCAMLVPTRQALEEAVEGRAANALLTSRSDCPTPDGFLLHPAFLSEYLKTSPAEGASPGEYNVQRPYSEEFGHFRSDCMFASGPMRQMLPAPDESEGTLPGFGIYELVSGFHELLHDQFDFFARECVELDLEAEAWTPGSMLLVGRFADTERGVFVEAAHCHTGDRARVLFEQFRERCGALMGGGLQVMRIRVSRWDFYGAMLKSLSQAVPYQQRNQTISLSRQLMRLITQEKHEAQLKRHVRLVAAEIISLANKLEVLHTGRDMLGEPLFGGQAPVAYTVRGVEEALHDPAPKARADGALKGKRPRGYGRSKARAEPPSDLLEDAQAGVETLFGMQLLPPEVSQSLSDLLLSHRHLKERSEGVREESAAAAAQEPRNTERGTRILRLMFESGHDWAPILRRIARYIYTPAFDRHYLPTIVQTQVAHETRAQRKVLFTFHRPARSACAARARSHDAVANPPQRRGC